MPLQFQLLFCPTCGLRRTGHAYQCSVCGGPLRRAARRPTAVASLLGYAPLATGWQDRAAAWPSLTEASPRQPVAA
jgi:hypothetical protein